MMRRQVLVMKERRWMIETPEMVLHGMESTWPPLMMGTRGYLC